MDRSKNVTSRYCGTVLGLSETVLMKATPEHDHHDMKEPELGSKISTQEAFGRVAQSFERGIADLVL